MFSHCSCRRHPVISILYALCSLLVLVTRTRARYSYSCSCSYSPDRLRSPSSWPPPLLLLLLQQIKDLVVAGVDVNVTDYDKRTGIRRPPTTEQARVACVLIVRSFVRSLVCMRSVAHRGLGRPLGRARAASPGEGQRASRGPLAKDCSCCSGRVQARGRRAVVEDPRRRAQRERQGVVGVVAMRGSV